MFNRLFSLVSLSLFLCGTAAATVTINLDIGRMTTSESVTLPGGTLWALITENSSGNLPGGLLADSSFNTNNNTQTIINDFAGSTIAEGNTIGGGTVMAIGSISNFFSGSIVETANFDITGLNTGDKLGIYWFPGRTTSSNAIPIGSAFEIGGFHRTAANPASGGNAGLVVPSDGASVNVYYLDSEIESSSGIDQTNFQAIAVPEPSTLLLLGTCLFLSFRRRSL